MLRVFVWCALFCLVYADNGTGFTYVATNRTVEECKNCLSKCCPGTQIILNDTCVENVHGVKELQEMEVDIYDNDIKKTDKTLKIFTLVYGDVFNSSNAFSIDLYPYEKLYLIENGELRLRRSNYLDQWGESMTYQDFCVEVQVSAGPGSSVVADTEKLVYKQIYGDYVEDEDIKTKDDIVAGGMLVSCFFLLLVLAAHAVLPQKRNLHGLMLMTYVSCLATAFLFIAVQVYGISSFGKTKCIAIGLTVYFTFLASFTWLNVMSYDMWSTTSKSLCRTWEPRRRILARFGWYSLYGFGAPLLTTVFLVCIDYADLTAVPNFVKPHFVFGSEGSCNFESDNERRIYVHGPMLVATVINIILFAMTGLFIWRHSAKPGGTGESRNTKKDQNRFLIYVKLTVIMGVNWIMDVASAFISPDSWVWYLPDVFNSLVGLFIFLIVVCKKDMFLLLCKRFSINTRFTGQLESTVDTSVSLTKRQLSDKESDGSTNMIPDGFSENPARSY